jgi:hypothetical protein
VEGRILYIVLGWVWIEIGLGDGMKDVPIIFVSLIFFHFGVGVDVPLWNRQNLAEIWAWEWSVRILKIRMLFHINILLCIGSIPKRKQETEE